MVLFNAASGRHPHRRGGGRADRGPSRGGRCERARQQDMLQLLGGSPLVLDGLRVRPRYFDGRFLTSSDLTRDQDYVASARPTWRAPPVRASCWDCK